VVVEYGCRRNEEEEKGLMHLWDPGEREEFGCEI